MGRLDRMGYVSPERLSGQGYLSLHAGAAAACAWLEQSVPFDLREQRRGLAADIETRVEWAESMLEWLTSSHGPGREHIEPALRWSDFWRQHGDDPELVALDSERRSALDRTFDADEGANGPAREESRRCQEAYVDRLRDLQDAYVPAVSLDALPQLRKRGAGLRQAKSTGALLARYRTLDMNLGVFEEAHAEVAIGWDDHVEAEVRGSLGKTPTVIWTDEDGHEHTVFLE